MCNYIMVVLLVEWDRCFLDVYIYTYMFFILLVNYPLDFGWLGFLNGPCVGDGWSLVGICATFWDLNTHMTVNGL